MHIYREEMCMQCYVCIHVCMSVCMMLRTKLHFYWNRKYIASYYFIYTPCSLNTMPSKCRVNYNILSTPTVFAVYGPYIGFVFLREFTCQRSVSLKGFCPGTGSFFPCVYVIVHWWPDGIFVKILHVYFVKS